MPPKAKTPAPIDRPLSRAYLREFTGWSPAFPPGLSDPTSLRIMENMWINRDGSIRVRPGLRYLSLQDDGFFSAVPIDTPIVGTHEPFFMADGSKAYLFAVREADGGVGFRVLAQGPLGMLVQSLVGAGVGGSESFAIPGGYESLKFSDATTYVKYLQIDNKIFALSNAGEPMRLFHVGEVKSAKALSSITVPDWEISDKLTVVHPDAGWVTSSTPLSTRRNRVTNPAMNSVANWTVPSGTTMKKTRTDTLAQQGSYSMRLESLPLRRNLVPNPLLSPLTNGVGGWTSGGSGDPDPPEAFTGDTMRIFIPSGSATRQAKAEYADIPIDGGADLKVALDLDQVGTHIGEMWWRFTFKNASGGTVGSTVDLSIDHHTTGRKTSPAFAAPSGAVSMTMMVWARCNNSSDTQFRISDVLLNYNQSNTSSFDGSSGADYGWEGTPHASASYLHPAQDLRIETTITGVVAEDWSASIYVRSSAADRVGRLIMEYPVGGGSEVADPEAFTSTAGAWTRVHNAHTVAAIENDLTMIVEIDAVPRGEYHYLDSALFEKGLTLQDYFDGDTTDTGTVINEWVGDPYDSHSLQSTYAAPGTLPGSETKTANTLISSGSNDYSFGFFYTFNNEVGESAASMVTIVRTQRAWSQWLWETANAAGEPSGTPTQDPALAADQLVAYMPQPVFEQAQLAGATHWNLYMLTWSNQDPVPVQAQLIGRRAINALSTHGESGFLRATPQAVDLSQSTSLVPSADTRYNYSEPSRAGQGIVAADRMILVYDPTAAAVIRWSSNLQGRYTDFSASKGGGYKTLTSGNLYVPAAVALWQNPQSVDTITILCLGTDGRSTGYYMAPSQIASQSEQVNVMGFEETTATPGTTSPYGVEVLNNALYHPLDEMLMKSTANNYNISHKNQTEPIDNVWKRLVNKHQIVSSHHDNRLYYLVNNPDGENLEDGCWGNEVWVYDIQAENGHWSRWLVQGHSLRMIEQEGRTYMSLVRPDGIYYFDPAYDRDDVINPDIGQVIQQYIPWKIETNTQGANRAHDAWAHLQQANITLGNFLGQLRYGIRSFDRHGKPVEISKVVYDKGESSDLAWDLEDFLLIQRDLREWFFFAESVEEDGVTQWSAGQISLVQYRYTPVSVNIGYEFGSVETFEYGRAALPSGHRTADSGVPQPFVDYRRP